MEHNQSPRKTIRISKKALGLTLLVVIIIAIVLIISQNRYRYGIMPMMGIGMGGGEIQSANSLPSIDFGDYPQDGRYRDQGDQSAKDTREFMKTSYSSQIRTRNVANMMRDIKNSVKGADGRVDSFSSSQMNGYISFVIPKDKFDEFKNEVETLTHKKLYTENISSENLLNQKQSIEQRMANAKDMLAQYQQQRKDATAYHVALINSYNQDAANKKTEIDAENSRFATQLSGIMSQINYANSLINGTVKADEKFTDNIETVNGSISVNWISVWQLMRLYSPISPVIIIIVLVLGLWYGLARKGVIPSIELV